MNTRLSWCCLKSHCVQIVAVEREVMAGPTEPAIFSKETTKKRGYMLPAGKKIEQLAAVCSWLLCYVYLISQSSTLSCLLFSLLFKPTLIFLVSSLFFPIYYSGISKPHRFLLSVFRRLLLFSLLDLPPFSAFYLSASSALHLAHVPTSLPSISCLDPKLSTFPVIQDELAGAVRRASTHDPEGNVGLTAWPETQPSRHSFQGMERVL
jgi:hypothetical protein